MEMESSRRSIDRSRDQPGAKKPRLVEDDSLDRALNGVERSFSRSGLTTVPARYNKINERERDVQRSNDSVRGGGVQLQQQQQKPQIHNQQHNQELVSQYKTALAELTFNSKPIITNLTIIAGENQHVAKWIAATICANILEVPSEQKLPSLYLLDSIVKNIGRDYIKYFAGRLPEVFCKAYRQVDSSVHSGMRHLFGTWKGVFPLACLQMIEKELGFSSAINGTSSGTGGSRAESQSQRPPHSIHVNPKYLEARQRLQQSSRVKGVGVSSGSSVPSDDDDVEIPDRNTRGGSERPWTDLPVKELKHPNREASSESLHEKNSAGYEDNEYCSDLSRNSDLGYTRSGERVTEQDGRDKSWYGADRSAMDATASQRSTLSGQREFPKYRASRPGAASIQMQQKGPIPAIVQSGSKVMNENWKNSEEEEYMWDDMGSRFPTKERWTGDDAEKMDTEDRLPQPRGEIALGPKSHGDAFSAHRGQTTFGHRIPPTWPSRDPHIGDKHIGTTSKVSGQSDGHLLELGDLPASIGSTLARAGLQTLPGQSSMLPHPSSPSSASLRHHQELYSSTEDERLQSRSVSLPGQNIANHSLLPNRSYYTEPAKNPFPAISQNHVQPSGLQTFQSIQSQPQHLQKSSTSTPSQRQHHSPFTLQPYPDPTSLPSGQIQKPLPQSPVMGNPPKTGNSALSHSSISFADVSGKSNTSSVLATLIKSGILSTNSVSGGFPSVSFQDSVTLPPQLNAHPPLPSGRPPIQLVTSAPTVSRSSLLDTATNILKSVAVPPLPPGPPPASSVSGTLSQTSTQNILSSLVAKGLITAQKESPTCTTPQLPSHPQNQSPARSTSSSSLVTSNPSPPTIFTSSSGNELLFPESAAKRSPRYSQDVTTERKDLIGTVFKADIIRQSHPSVISDLFKDLPHQCNRCGLGFKFRKVLDRHLEWHASRMPELSSPRVSRRWFADSGDWVCGTVKPVSGPTSTSSGKGLIIGVEKSEPIVPADETQCVCILCGEPFEDFYCHDSEEWKFKGAVYMAIPTVGGKAGVAADVNIEGPIVHKNCISQSSVYDLGLMNNVKQEKMKG